MLEVFIKGGILFVSGKIDMEDDGDQNIVGFW